MTDKRHVERTAQLKNCRNLKCLLVLGQQTTNNRSNTLEASSGILGCGLSFIICMACTGGNSSTAAMVCCGACFDWVCDPICNSLLPGGTLPAGTCCWAV